MFEREIARGCEGIKPGWVRVNFNYFISEMVFAFILDAVELVAQQGWKLLPQYSFDATSGLWFHRDGPFEPPVSLRDIDYSELRMQHSAHRHEAPESALPGYLDEARTILAAAAGGRVPEPVAMTADFESLRWFWLPDEVAVG